MPMPIDGGDKDDKDDDVTTTTAKWNAPTTDILHNPPHAAKLV